MSESPVLLLMILLLPCQFAARGADGKGRIQKDQDIRVGNPLPHGLHVRVFLRDVTTRIAMLFKPCDQRGFARAAGSNNTNQRSITWRLHKNFVVTTEVVTTDELMIILHQPAELFGPAEHCQRITGMKWARICGMHFGLMVMPEQNNVEAVIIFHITNCLICQDR